MSAGRELPLGNIYEQNALELRTMLGDPAVNSFEHAIAWPRLQALLPRDRGIRRILDFGCGPGNFTLELAALYPKAQVTGVDETAAILPAAQRQLNDRIQFLSWDGKVPNHPDRRKELRSRLGLDEAKGGFDLVVAKMSLHYMLNNFSNIEGWWHLLAPKATLAFSVPHDYVSNSKVAPDSSRIDCYNGFSYESEVGNTGLRATMAHRAASDWLGSLLSTNAFHVQGYRPIVDMPADESGKQKRLDVLVAYKPNLTAIVQRMRELEGSSPIPKYQLLLGKLGLHGAGVVDRGHSTTDNLSGMIIKEGKIFDHQAEVAYWLD